MSKMRVIDIGYLQYIDALTIMRSLVEYKKHNTCEDILIVTEHEHVLTMGRQGTKADILISDHQANTLNLKVYPVERGGLVTYHGPGQIMAYPICDLNALGIKAVDFVQEGNYLSI